MDLATLQHLATAAVPALSLILKKALEKGAETLGQSATNAMLDKLKKNAGTAEALEDLSKAPDDGDLQTVLKVKLRKALEADAELATLLRQWLDANGAMDQSIHQTANNTGDNSKIIQIVGSGNSVG